MGVLPDWMILRDVKIDPPPANPAKDVGVISHGISSYGVDMRIGYKFKIFTPTYSTVVDPKDFNPQSFMERDLTPTSHHQWKLTDDVRECVNCGSQNLYGDLEEFKKWLQETCPKHPPNFVIIPPNSFALGESVETFTIPRDCLCIVLGKSTYARVGVIVNVTPGEPEWTGKWTIEVSNSTPLPVKVYAGEGIAQAIFFRSDGYREIHQKAIMEFLDEFSDNIHVTQGLANGIHDALPKLLQEGTCRVSYADKGGKYNHQKGLTLPFVKQQP